MLKSGPFSLGVDGLPDSRSMALERQHPCTLAQERFWILDRLLPGNPALNIAVRWRLVGRVATNELEQAFRLILSRHEGLRTAFIERAWDLVQIVKPSVPFRLPAVD